MFELIVTGKDNAEKIIESGWPTKIISLLTERIQFRGPHHLHLRFDDIERPTKGLICPSFVQLDQLFNFSASFTKNDKVLVHCFAGISRSTAAAIGILIQHGETPESAFRIVEKLSPNLSPNEFIINDIELRFKCNGRLHNIVDTIVGLRIKTLLESL